MFHLFEKGNRNASHGLLSDLLTKVSDIGKLISTEKESDELSLLELCENLLKKKGEATGLAQASDIIHRYHEMDIDEKRVFFKEVLHTFGTNKEALDAAVAQWLETHSEESARNLHFVAEPDSQSLIRKLNQATNATLSLVKMRSDLLRVIKDNPELKILDQDFEHLFRSWFNRGFLSLQRISWETSASVLEKIIAYEAVHEIRSWDDLRLRVAAQDRRLYAYFHPALGLEPLIFVEVALTEEIPNSIASILAESRESLNPKEATTAVFYSISNCQRGLRGVSFGNFLIKQVVESLRHEFPNLDTFVTLSPVTGFRQWALNQLESSDSIISSDDVSFINDLEKHKNEGALSESSLDLTQLKKLAAIYLVNTRSPRGGASDAVSRFHLENGAQLENIHVLADISNNGLNNSWGCMVNYQYRVDDIEKNHEAYVNGDEIIISTAVRKLLT